MLAIALAYLFGLGCLAVGAMVAILALDKWGEVEASKTRRADAEAKANEQLRIYAEIQERRGQ